MLYTNASFTNASEERKSITGYVSLLAGACITWKNIKQDYISLNTAESDLVAASEGVREAMWLMLLLKKLGHSSTKHIDIRHLYARDKHEAECISVTYCSTNDMIADALTKPLIQGQFEKLRLMVDVKDLEL
ncbi:Retrotransposon Tca5 Polyprotein [Phytophthora megakarya]|uniref:Retrotransposon Tca5 Polyprotein n=1 Tax=Phytophthora megakarya TaxID=4795 RepID=A0A225V3N8_9STRA|nr:Retrotransposon Tca5 Polyprotein [Phytophthora megakarya]